MLSLAALAACGDKVEIIQPTTSAPAVTGITLSNTAPSVAVGQNVAIAANVTADAGFAGDRGVTWTVSGAAVSQVASDANTITLRGVSAGTAIVTATSIANTAITQRATVTVTGAPGGNQSATVVIAGILQGANTVSSVPGTASNAACAAGAAPNQTVDITNACGQINVNVTYDPGSTTATKLELILTPTGSTTGIVCDTRNIGVATALGSDDATLDPTTVQMSCNTAQATAAGVTTFRNGTYTLSARLTTSSGGTSSATQATTSITLNNADYIATQINTTGVNNAADPLGQVWFGGPTTTFPGLTVQVTPVFFTAGRTLGNGTNTVTVRLADAATNATLSANAVETISTATGQTSVTFDNTTAAATDQIPTITNANVVARVTGVDNSGNALPNGGGATFGAAQSQVIRLDTQGPPNVSAYSFTGQGGQNNWINGSQSFAFSTAAGATNPVGFTPDAGLAADNGGVDRVTVTFQFAPTGTATWTNVTSGSDAALAESNTAATYDLRAVATDALGNVTNSAVLGSFGVDRTAPTATVVTSPAVTAPFEIVGIGQALTTTTFAVGTSDAQGGNGATGSGVSGTTGLLVSVRRISPSGTTGQTSACAGGFGSGGAACSTMTANPTTIALPTAVGEYLVTYAVTDQAGNRTATSTFNYYVDNDPATSAPTVSGGMAIPASITEGTTFSVGATDNMDVATGNARVDYPYGLRLFYTGSASPAGVAFDGTLTRTSTVSASLTGFYRGLTEITGAAGAATFTAGGGKPTAIGLRAVDVANNLAVGNTDNIPANNVTGAGAGGAYSNPFTIGTTGVAGELQSFQVTSSNMSIDNSGAVVAASSTNLRARVTTANTATTSPFSSVCFYYQTNVGTEGALGGINGSAAGEWVLIGCTSTVVTVSEPATPTLRFFDYSFNGFNPDNRLGTAGNLNIRAIGVNANRDALVSAAVAPALVP